MRKSPKLSSEVMKRAVRMDFDAKDQCPRKPGVSLQKRGPWKTGEAVERGTLDWVSWFNPHRLQEPIGQMPPAEAEASSWRQQAQASPDISEQVPQPQREHVLVLARCAAAIEALAGRALVVQRDHVGDDRGSFGEIVVGAEAPEVAVVAGA